MNQAELERGFEDDEDESEFDSEAEEENRHAEEERKKAEKARLEFLDTIFVFVAFIIILGAAGGEDILLSFTRHSYLNDKRCISGIVVGKNLLFPDEHNITWVPLEQQVCKSCYFALVKIIEYPSDQQQHQVHSQWLHPLQRSGSFTNRL